MNFKSTAISSLAKLVLGSNLWANARHLVSTLETDTNLTNAEKRASVFNDLKILAGDVGSVLLNCAIELALLWIRGIRV
tara:strand:- start:520 stop:756 length:237 start_codon:yes stop_codon:yes gene_type:complete